MEGASCTRLYFTTNVHEPVGEGEKLTQISEMRVVVAGRRTVLGLFVFKRMNTDVQGLGRACRQEWGWEGGEGGGLRGSGV